MIAFVIQRLTEEVCTADSWFYVLVSGFVDIHDLGSMQKRRLNPRLRFRLLHWTHREDARNNCRLRTAFCLSLRREEEEQ